MAIECARFIPELYFGILFLVGILFDSLRKGQ
jgi:hypothetical protein